MAKTGKFKITTALLMFFVSVGFAAEPTVTAKVSATDMTLNSQIMLSLEVSGISNLNGTPNLTLPDFETQPAGQTSSFQWINGQSSSLVTINYVLTPTKAGTLIIPAITLNVGGKSYTTQQIAVTVRPESGSSQTAPAPEPGSKQVEVPAEGLKPIFMTATVDSAKVYVGQQILLKVQFLKRPDVRFSSQARYTAPETTGFLVEPLKQQEYSTNINGVRYEVTELPYALFPTSDGDFAIGSAQIELAVRSEPDPFDPNSFFQGFFGRSQVAKLNTRPISVRVRALPSNKPTNFSGAVGRFKLNAKLDGDQFEVGKPFNLIINVEGVGNIKTLREPTLPDLKGLRRYETLSDSKVTSDNKFINGSKEFKILLIPQVSGQLAIPQASFVYFNPAKNEYVTEVTPEIPIQVKPGKLNQDNQETIAQPISAGQTLSGVRVMEKDIRFIKAGKVRPIRPPLYMQPLFSIFSFIPPLFAFVAFLSKRQTVLRVEKAAEFRSKGALKVARRELQKARKSVKSSDPASFHTAIHKAVSGYLADKFFLSSAGLIWDEVDQQLNKNKVTVELRNEIRNIFDQADMARFATSSFTDETRDETLASAELVLKKLDEVL